MLASSCEGESGLQELACLLFGTISKRERLLPPHLLPETQDNLSAALRKEPSNPEGSGSDRSATVEQLPWGLFSKLCAPFGCRPYYGTQCIRDTKMRP